jgi:hypothetical protein
MYKQTEMELLMMGYELLLGFTKDKEVVFGEVEYRDGQFSASFDVSFPMEIGYDETMDRINDLIEQMDSKWVLDKLYDYDCNPSELSKKLYHDTYNAVEEFFDISLYSESFIIDGVEDDIYFLASSCGQHDTRKEMSTYINRELYNYIHELWDEYHLKEMPKEKFDKLVEAIEHQNNTIHDYDVIENWLINNFK